VDSRQLDRSETIGDLGGFAGSSCWVRAAVAAMKGPGPSHRTIANVGMRQFGVQG
jgi:hypothetical protein